jgi:hypothetical protein
MVQKEKKSYLSAIFNRYANANRQEKKQILDEFCAVCTYNRKYAIRILSKKPTPNKKKTGPKYTYYGDDFIEVLKKFWFAADQPCSRKLKAIIPAWLPSYEDMYGIIKPTVKEKLSTISSATIDRILKTTKAKSKLKGRCTTKPGSLLKKNIPIQSGHWAVDKPGYLEADTVAHCGDSVAGKFAWSLTVTDIHTGWTENRATWNKWSAGIYREISNIEATLPFKVLGFDSDNGAEFINHALYEYFTDREEPVLFTRSRPYRKNDNAHVEQKNWTHVRQLYGYDRLDDKRIVVMMNELYKNEWSLYQNHFMPSMKLISKERLGSKYKKRYEAPKTPYERILDTDLIDNNTKEKLIAIHKTVNPFKLKKDIENKLTMIFHNVRVTSNVRHRI